MGTATVVALRAARWEPCIFTVVVMGLDLAEAELNARVLLSPGLQQTPLISVNRTGAVRAPGVRVVSVEDDDWGRTTKLEVVFSQAQMQDLPQAAERDAALELAWALDIRLPGYLTPTRIYGPFTLTPDGGTSIGAGGPFTFGDQVIHVRVEAGQGPRGRASGPLGAGSVGSEEISDDPDEQNAIRDKIGAGGITRLFDVKRFGAVGNYAGVVGTANDDYPALVSAIEAASANGGVVWLFGDHLIKDFPLVIQASNITFAGPGSLYFVTDDVEVMGWLFFDGREGRLDHVGFHQIKLYGPAGLLPTGIFDDDGNYIIDPGQPGYDSSSSLANFINCDHVTVGGGARVVDAPTYGVGAFNSYDVTVDGLSGARCPAIVQCQGGTGPLRYHNVTGEDTTDDFIAVGYWGEGENDQITISNCAGRRIGGRGVVVFGYTGHASLTNIDIVDSFLSPFLIEGNAKIPENKRIGSITMTGCRSKRGGMWNPAGYNRGADVAAGISINPRGGRIGAVQIIGHTGEDSRNGHLWCEGSGSVGSIEVIGGRFARIAGFIPQGEPIYSDEGTGASLPPVDGNYSGMKFTNADLVRLSDFELEGARHDGIIIGAMADRAYVDRIDVRSIDEAAVGTQAAVRNFALKGWTDRITLSGSPVGATAIISANQQVSSPQSKVIAKPVAIATATFSGGDTAFSSTGLGSTTTGSKVWAGDPARVIGGVAKFNTLAESSQVIDAGAPNIFITAKVTLADGQNAKLVGRTVSTGSRTGSHVLFDLQCSDDTYVESNLIFYNTGIGGAQPGATSALPMVPSGTWYMGLLIEGDSAQAFLGPTLNTMLKIAGWHSPAALPVTNYFGIQTGTAFPGGPSFDDITWWSVPA